MIEVKPQFKQELALCCNSSFLFLGGAKGGGKSYALLLRPLYHIHIAGYRAVIFRRTLEEVKKPGGLWDKSYNFYSYLGGIPSISELKWTFPSGATVKFSHLQKPESHRTWYGTEVAFFGFDQLEEFTFKHFQSIFTSMRSTCGVRTQVFATVNPIAPHWVRDFVEPWLAEDGYVDLEKNNKEFHFTFNDSGVDWLSDERKEDKSLVFSNGLFQGIKDKLISATFIASDIYDNQVLLDEDPQYLTNLNSLPLVDRERYLGIKGRGGNWNIKEEGGNIFKKEWFNIIHDYKYQSGDRLIRFWDFGFSLKDLQKGDPNANCLMVKRGNEYIILDCREVRGTPDAVNRIVFTKGLQDQKIDSLAKTIYHQDPGASGTRDAVETRKKLSGLNVYFWVEHQDKVKRAKEVSASCEQGKISLLYGEWNIKFLNQLEAFPDVKNDDMVDSMTGAYNSFNLKQTNVNQYRY